VLARGLEKEPAHRFASVVALAHELAGWAMREGAVSDVLGTALAARWPAVAPTPVPEGRR
jgi:hypothetical protein